MKDIQKMTLKELAVLVDSPETAKEYKDEISDRLGSMCWQIGELWDKLEGVDSLNGPVVKYGTRNRKSMTYKLRKVARFSYP